MPPSIHRSSSVNSAPAAVAGRAIRSSNREREFSTGVTRVSSARRHSMPDIGARRVGAADGDASALRESFHRQLDTVSSRPQQPPAGEPREAGVPTGESHGATSLEQARAYLGELAGDRRGALTTLVARLNGHDQRALDHLALTVHALHLTADDARHADAFAGIGDALASFFAAAARSGGKSAPMSRDLCIEDNKHYRKLCERVGSLLRADGIADAMFGRARERGDAAADVLVSERLGGRMDGSVRTNGMLNQHSGRAQLSMADNAMKFALGARHATNLVDMAGTALALLGRTDQLLNDVSLKQPATDPGGPRAPRGEPAAPQGGPEPGAAPQPAAPVVVNNHNENNVNVNLDGLEKLVSDLGRTIGALLTRMDGFDPSRAQRPADDANGPVRERTGGHSTVVKSPVSFAQTSNVTSGSPSPDVRVELDGDRPGNRQAGSPTVLQNGLLQTGSQTGSPRAPVDGARHDAPASAASEPSADRRTPPPATVERGVGADAPPTGAWRYNDNDKKWQMDRADPIVRTTEGATRIDPFSRAGARATPGAGDTRAPRDAGQRSVTDGASDSAGGDAALRSTEGFGRNLPFAGSRRNASVSGAASESSSSSSSAPGAAPAAPTVASTLASTGASSVAPDDGVWPRPSAPATRSVDPRQMNRAQLERAGLYPLDDDDALSSAQAAPTDATTRRAWRPDVGLSKPKAGEHKAKTFPTVEPAARIMTTEGATRVGWADSIDKGAKR
ncbi:hypothetical protein [Burkholderia oklahomensis]|uniref:hypothetical protein n=2 Tax=Burkholderia oklahomensis TaxID=342113 RepID=UPI000473C05A|nr:hypothetical protein [Burkholderia oklahomensis]AJX34329.1 hypothetical protein BG90_4796 [Burkholderia oklahomensis C6786]AOI48520.1 hypothetical protein WI23_21905 [Burkholderia oklahomensis C6786]KUY48197.1 hypothetical protein WI23_28460 [Burkholderia oklahomensis C6786]MBI0363314.1 hypothetical protein [Burkholderia oklahomensis]SUY27430.1 Uncharacterised protein [Burkholderia oklahomensis]